MNKQTIFIVEDDPVYCELLNIVLSPTYITHVCKNGLDAIESLKTVIPDLILTDYFMPGMDGLSLCKHIKQNLVLSKIPVIIISAIADGKTKALLIEAGADACIEKPNLDMRFLFAKIEMEIRKSRKRIQQLNANALTHLPGNLEIQKKLQGILCEKEYSIAYLDIDNFKAYNDVYGFIPGDSVIKNTAEILVKILKHFQNPHTFLGHIGGDDFLFIVKDKDITLVCVYIMQEFDKYLRKWYKKEHLDLGYLIVPDRAGITRHIPLISISIAIIELARRKISHIGQINEIGMELKKYAKTIEGSIWVKDKRKGD